MSGHRQDIGLRLVTGRGTPSTADLPGTDLPGTDLLGSDPLGPEFLGSEPDIFGSDPDMFGSRATVSTMDIDAPVAGRALVVVVDDRTAHGGVDSIGPLVTELLTEAGFLVDASVSVQADEVEIRNALNTAVIGGVDLVVSVGGTGMSPRDVTPEATSQVLDRELPGISEALRASGRVAGSLDAGLSRGLAGISGSTLVVNLPGTRAAVRDTMATLAPLAGKVIGELSGLAE